MGKLCIKSSTGELLGREEKHSSYTLNVDCLLIKIMSNKYNKYVVNETIQHLVISVSDNIFGGIIVVYYKYDLSPPKTRYLYLRKIYVYEARWTNYV